MKEYVKKIYAETVTDNSIFCQSSLLYNIVNIFKLSSLNIIDIIEEIFMYICYFNTISIILYESVTWLWKKIDRNTLLVFEEKYCGRS